MSQTEHQLSLSPFYKGWDVYQQRLVAAIAPLTAEQLALRAAPQQWSIGILAAHVIAARVAWFHIRMGEGSSDLAPMAVWDEDGEPLRSAAELVAGFEATWQVIQGALARWTPADFEQAFPQSLSGRLACAFTPVYHLACARTRHPSRRRTLLHPRRTRPGSGRFRVRACHYSVPLAISMQL